MVYYLLLIVGAMLAYWAAKVLLLLACVKSYKKYWTVQNQRPDSDNQLVYYAIGYSTAQGIGASRPEKSYPYLVARWLEKQTARPVKLINLSVSGAKIQQAYDAQLPQMYREHKPHIVTVAIGANNIEGFKAETFTAEMMNLLRILPRGTYVADVPCFNGRLKDDNWKVIQANEQLHRNLASMNHHAVALYDETKNNTKFRFFAADWFHPSTKGYASWANAFEKAMAEHIPELIELKT